MIRKYSKITVVDILSFLSILFIGADRLGIRVGTVQLRLVQAFVLFLCMDLLFMNHWKLVVPLSVLAFAVLSLCSVICSKYIDRAALYYSNIFFNVFINFTAFALYLKLRGIDTFIKIYRTTMYIQLSLMVIQMLLGYRGYNLFGIQGYGLWHGFVRIPLWFYEPSYLATYLVFWVMLSLSMWIIYDDISYKKDAILSILAEIITTSTTGYLGVAVCFAILYSVLLLSKKLSSRTSLLILFLIVAFYFFAQTTLYDAVIGRIGRQGFTGASGHRVTGWSETLDVFTSNVLMGVGPGCYGRYLGADDGAVPTNVTLELLATLGLISTLAYYSLHFNVIIKCFRYTEKSMEQAFMFSASLGLIAFVITLQANQNYLRPYHWMILGVLEGCILATSNSKKFVYSVGSTLS